MRSVNEVDPRVHADAKHQRDDDDIDEIERDVQQSHEADGQACREEQRRQDEQHVRDPAPEHPEEQ